MEQVEQSASAEQGVNESQGAPQGESDQPQGSVQNKPPEKYELKAPEGVELDPGHVDKIASFAREQGLSQEVAQAILQRDAEFIKAANDQQQQAIEERRQEWVKALRSDQVYGGHNYDRTVELANSVIERFAPEGFVENLGILKDHDGFMKFLANIGKATKEDKLVGGTKPPAKDEKTYAQKWYPNMNP